MSKECNYSTSHPSPWCFSAEVQHFRNAKAQRNGNGIGTERASRNELYAAPCVGMIDTGACRCNETDAVSSAPVIY